MGCWMFNGNGIEINEGEYKAQQIQTKTVLIHTCSNIAVN